jgi:hypothetical protein
VGDTPVAPPDCKPNFDDFQKPGGIWDTAIDVPDMSKNCVANGGCHEESTGRSALRFIYKTPRTAMTLSDFQANYDVLTRFLNCSNPAASPFITKPEAGTDPHLGGDLWTCAGGSCQPEMDIEAWIETH